MLRDCLDAPKDALSQKFAPVSTQVKQWKSTRKLDGKKIRIEASKFREFAHVSAAQLKAELLSYDAATASEWFLQSILERACNAKPDSAKRILAAKDQCPALKTYLGLCDLSMMAETLPKGFGGGDAFFELLKHDRNDFFDAALTSVAAYCTHFVSRDETLLRRCKLLRQSNWVQFDGLHLENDLNL